MPSNKLVDTDTFTTTEESIVHHVTNTVHDASTKLGVILIIHFKDESNTDRGNKDPTKGESNKRPSPEVAANAAHTHASFLFVYRKYDGFLDIRKVVA